MSKTKIYQNRYKHFDKYDKLCKHFINWKKNYEPNDARIPLYKGFYKANENDDEFITTFREKCPIENIYDNKTFKKYINDQIKNMEDVLIHGITPVDELSENLFDDIIPEFIDENYIGSKTFLPTDLEFPSSIFDDTKKRKREQINIITRSKKHKPDAGSRRKSKSRKSRRKSKSSRKKKSKSKKRKY